MQTSNRSPITTYSAPSISSSSASQMHRGKQGVSTRTTLSAFEMRDSNSSPSPSSSQSKARVDYSDSDSDENFDLEKYMSGSESSQDDDRGRARPTDNSLKSDACDDSSDEREHVSVQWVRTPRSRIAAKEVKVRMAT